MKRCMLIALLLAISIGVSGGASLYTSDSFFTSMLSDTKASKVGDVLHIIVTESATATQSARRTHAKESSTTAGAGSGWLKFIKLMGYSGASDYNASGMSTNRGSMTTRLTVTVTEVLPNGNLLIEGHRHVLINKDVQDITVRGEVRPRDISADNSVLSYQVANVQIEYVGSDPGKPGSKVGIISRILNFLF